MEAPFPTFALALGYIQADSLQGLTLGGDASAITGGTLIPSSLDNIVFAENSFENLAFPVVLATALGAARFESNIMRSCITGFTIMPLIASVASVAGAAKVALNDTRVQVLNNAFAQQMLSIAVTYPRPTSFVPTRVIEVRRRDNVCSARPLHTNIPDHLFAGKPVRVDRFESPIHIGDPSASDGDRGGGTCVPINQAHGSNPKNAPDGGRQACFIQAHYRRAGRGRSRDRREDPELQSTHRSHWAVCVPSERDRHCKYQS